MTAALVILCLVLVGYISGMIAVRVKGGRDVFLLFVFSSWLGFLYLKAFKE